MSRGGTSRVLAVLSALGLLLATACATTGGGTTAPPGAGNVGAATAASGQGSAGLPLASEKIVFGAPVSLTGSTAKEGKATQQGYQLWVDAVNKAGGIPVGGKRFLVEVKILDDQSSGDTSAQLAEKLIKEEKVNFLLGPYGTTPTLAVSRVAEQNGVPMVEGNGAAGQIFNQGYQYTFGVLSPASQYLTGIIDFALAQTPRPTTMALLYADDAFSTEAAEATRKYAEEKGISVVYYEKYKNAETNLTAQVTGAKAKNPDLVFNSGHLQEAIAILKQAKDLGLNAKLFAFSVGPGLPDWNQALGPDGDYVVTGSQWTAVLKYNGDDYWKTPEKYAEEYKAKFGEDPPYQAADATAAALAFDRALRTANSLDRDKVRDAIARLDFMTFYGQIKFDARGANIYKPMVVEQWQSGKRVTIWPPDVANAKGLYPTPEWGKR